MKERENIIETFSELSPRYEEVVDLELVTFWGWHYHDFIDFMLNRTQITSSDKILDIATGTGVVPRKLIHREELHHPVNGFDITFKMLSNAKKKVKDAEITDKVNLTCASAMQMPYKNSSFSLVICALATHHMNVDEMLSEIHRVLEDNGKLVMADVGASPLWKIPGVSFLISVLGFIYFLFKENLSRALAEAMSLKNIRTDADWIADLTKWGFSEIQVEKLDSKYKWIPSPLFIKAKK